MYLIDDHYFHFVFKNLLVLAVDEYSPLKAKMITSVVAENKFQVSSCLEKILTTIFFVSLLIKKQVTTVHLSMFLTEVLLI